MHKRCVMSTVASLILTVVCGGRPLVFAEETRCTGTFGAITLDNIVVPDGPTCTLNGTREGNVVILTGPTLKANGVRVNGNIQAEGAHQRGVDVFLCKPRSVSEVEQTVCGLLVSRQESHRR
jgi:hypothetical protein